MLIPITCTLNEGGNVVFDVTDTTADDYDDTWQVYQMFQTTVGS